jgi:glycine betaine/proline transport system ATP-binding protein
VAKHVSVENLSIVFGKAKAQKEALKLIDEGLSPAQIRQQTGATVANKNVNFEIMPDELFVIVGLSGSGKSTFIRSLNLLNTPTRGDIKINGESLLNLNKEALRNYRRKDVSMVFQHFGLLSHRTVIENVEYPLEVQGIGKAIRREKSLHVIEQVGLNGWENSLPSQLSGGMRQRVGLARALVNDPELLLMDEPYSALDPLIRREMQNELLTLDDSFERTIVFITHDMNEAFRIGDRIALMKDAEVVQIGTPLEFFANPANDYVRDFIADVDKSRVLKARNVMRQPKNVVSIDQSAKEARELMNQLETEFLFVIGDNKRYCGFVDGETLKGKSSHTLEEIVQEDDNTLRRNMYLNEALKIMSDATYDVAVLDKNHRLRGVVTSEELIQALSE